MSKGSRKKGSRSLHASSSAVRQVSHPGSVVDEVLLVSVPRISTNTSVALRRASRVAGVASGALAAVGNAEERVVNAVAAAASCNASIAGHYELIRALIIASDSTC